MRRFSFARSDRGPTGVSFTKNTLHSSAAALRPASGVRLNGTHAPRGDPRPGRHAAPAATGLTCTAPTADWPWPLHDSTRASTADYASSCSHVSTADGPRSFECEPPKSEYVGGCGRFGSTRGGTALAVVAWGCQQRCRKPPSWAHRSRTRLCRSVNVVTSTSCLRCVAGESRPRAHHERCCSSLRCSWRA